MVVHLLRSAMKYACYRARKAMARNMRPIYTARTVQATELAMVVPGQCWRGGTPGTTSPRSSPLSRRSGKASYVTNQTDSIQLRVAENRQNQGFISLRRGRDPTGLPSGSGASKPPVATSSERPPDRGEVPSVQACSKHQVATRPRQLPTAAQTRVRFIIA